jgi:hypothetical protein
MCRGVHDRGATGVSMDTPGSPIWFGACPILS